MSELIDNRAKRIQTLKEIVQKLHHGAKPEEVRAQLTEIVRHASPGEIAAMEQQLMAEGVTVNEIKSMCDLHAGWCRISSPSKPRAMYYPGTRWTRFVSRTRPSGARWMS